MTHDDDLKEMYIRNIEALYYKAYRMCGVKNMGDTEHLKILLGLGVAEIEKPEDSLYFERKEYRSFYGNVVSRYVRTAEHRHAPLMLTVRYGYCSKLFSEASDLWQALANLPKAAPASVGETLRESALALASRAHLILDGLGVDTDMYPTLESPINRAKVAVHLARRLAIISSTMEYESVDMKEVKL